MTRMGTKYGKIVTVESAKCVFVHEVHVYHIYNQCHVL